jgi:hypothetical protein
LEEKLAYLSSASLLRICWYPRVVNQAKLAAAISRRHTTSLATHREGKTRIGRFGTDATGGDIDHGPGREQQYRDR